MKTFQKIIYIICLLLLCLSCQNSTEKNRISKNKVARLVEAAKNNEDNDSLSERYLDSAFTELSTNKNDTLTRFYYRKTTSGYYNLGNYQKSLLSGKRVLKLATQANDTVTMARALYYTADSFYQLSLNDSAFYYYTQSQKLYQQLEDYGTLGEIILYKAYIYYNIGEYVLCEGEAFSALKLLQKANKVEHIYSCYNLIATALDGQNNNDEAIEYYQRALDQLNQFVALGYPESSVDIYRASCYNNMGGVYEKTGQHSKAIELYNRALQYKNLETDNPALYAKLLNNLAYAKFKSGNLAGLPQMFFKSLRIRDSINNPSGIVASNTHLGEYFVAQRDTVRAINYLQSAYRQAKGIKSHYDILNTLKLLSDIDKRNSDFYNRRYITVSDSLDDIAKLNRNRYARIEYETDRLQDEKEALVKKNSFIIGVSAVVLLFIAAIFIIYYLNSRNKELLLIQEQQKANEEIYQLMFEQQSKIEAARTEEKGRIAMELHDGILNNIYAVRLNLEFINKKTDEESIQRRKEYIKELQTVESEIRSVSHDLSRNAIFNQDKSFEHMLEFMITSQKNNFDTIFDVEVDGTINWDSMSNLQKVNIYRIIQEALQNINKYSKAKHAKVTLNKEGNNIKIVVNDDGVGFDPEKAKGGIGLKNLRKRASSLNGSLEITSAEGKGSAIQVLFPV